MQPVLASAVTVAAFLVAAKAHGRQLRLERQANGHPEVQFGVANHAWVEGLWRRDRERFWATFAVGATAALTHVAISGATGLAFLGHAALLLGCCFAGSFLVTGVLSWLRTRQAEAASGAARGLARDASVGWWAGAVALWALAVGLAV